MQRVDDHGDRTCRSGDNGQCTYRVPREYEHEDAFACNGLQAVRNLGKICTRSLPGSNHSQGVVAPSIVDQRCRGAQERQVRLGQHSN